MNALIYTNEYPPCNYGGAGVHVEYLTRELSKLSGVDVDVRSFGNQKSGNNYPLKVKGYPIDSASFDAPQHLHAIFGSSQRAISFNADGNEADVVHCHTWYTHLAGIMTKMATSLQAKWRSHSRSTHYARTRALAAVLQPAPAPPAIVHSTAPLPPPSRRCRGLSACRHASPARERAC